ncbi:hypothetical protein HHL22_22120 [Hymenobacter sp. RP-2-7]|uniref:Peptidase S74 domain-containing protein n=1 Tax=Hymenobacter polaris TaxID=2682546 RepID=A0A7Y0FPT0_9BACT|nr:tail fiber domain-containing protein [Hymenobacter polaris]NML67906.1 hypothetical protein [Hymenobacter polaris]
MFQRYFLAPLAALLLLAAAPHVAHAQTGAVGIGTTAPDASAALDIVSSSKGLLLPRVASTAAIANPAPGLLVYQTGSPAGFYYNAGTAANPSWQQLATAGNTAGDNLGNHTATQALNLQGNALTGTGASISVVGVGIRADGGLNLGQSGGNIYLGYQAGQANTGVANQFSGYQSGYANTTGANNQFDGYYSGYNNLLGNSNLFIGLQSGFRNVYGSNNLYVGYQAGRVATNDNGQFIGYQSGYNNTTGTYNHFSGYQSGFRNISASYNQFNGYQSGYNNTGSFNYFSGYRSGYANTIGTQNQFEGYNSGAATTTGSNNLFSGYQSGANNVTGSSLTALGSNSGPASGSGALTNATALGANVSLTTSNTVVLGNGANVGIGTPAPGEKLEVAGNVKISGTGNGLTFPDGTFQSSASSLGNLLGDVTSSGTTTTYAAVVPAAKGGAGTVSGLLKANGSGQVSAAVAGTDYLTPTGNAATATYATVAGSANTVTTNANLTGDVTSSGNATTYAAVVPAAKGGAGTVSGLLKANGSGQVSAAAAGADYLTPTGSAASLTSFPTLNQNTTGNAATATYATVAGSANTVTTNANLTGDVTSSGNATTYAAVVPAAKGGAGTVSGLLKADGSGQVSAAVAGTDYLTPAAAGYIQNTTTQQSASFNISGNGLVGGNVGIGTTTTAPATQKLDVRGNLRLGADRGSGGGLGQTIEFVGPGFNTDPVGLYRTNPAEDYSELRVVVGEASDANDKFVVGRSSATTEGGLAAGTFTPTFTVTSAGSVGIGVAAPEAGLHIDQPESASTTAVGVLLSGGSSGNPSIELRGYGKTPYLDFVEGGNLDYTTRLLSSGGTLNLTYGGRAANRPTYLLNVDGGVTVGSSLALRNSTSEKYVWNLINGGLNLSESNVSVGRLFVQDGGNVGIGTTSPIAKLHVSGSASATPTGGNTSYFSGGSVLIGPQPPGGTTARATAAYFDGGQVWVNNTIVAGSLNTTSDQRIKHVIGLSDRTADLALLNQLRITDYTYLDQHANTDQVVKKVIAQEVEQVLPAAVSRSTQAIPNVYERATRVRYAQGQLAVTTAKAHELPANGGRMRFYTPANEALDVAVTVVDAHTVRFASAEAYAGGLFVYGKYVDDFRSVDYDALTTLNVSATQELARKVEALEQQNAALQAQATQATREASAAKAQATQATATLETFEARLRRLEAGSGGQAQR